MISVLFVNHGLSKICGVYSYGVRVYNLLHKSSNYTMHYTEVCNQEDLDKSILKYNPKIIVYNTPTGLMNFPSNQKSRYTNIKHISLSHDVTQQVIDSAPIIDFDAKIALDPTLIEKHNWYRTVRPLFSYYGNSNKVNVIPTIGSFGFYFPHKGFSSILQMVANEFLEANINLHITIAHFSNPSTKYEFECFKKWATSNLGLPKIKVKVTDNYTSDREQIDFLSKNDVNIFPYAYNYGSGPASVIDYAVAAGKPIMVSNSWQFNHVKGRLPLIGSSTITSAIMNGNSNVLELQKEWSDENFLKDYERIFNEVQNR